MARCGGGWDVAHYGGGVCPIVVTTTAEPIWLLIRCCTAVYNDEFLCLAHIGCPYRPYIPNVCLLARLSVSECDRQNKKKHQQKLTGGWQLPFLVVTMSTPHQLVWKCRASLTSCTHLCRTVLHVFNRSHLIHPTRHLDPLKRQVSPITFV